MTIVTSARDLRRFTPAHYGDDPSAPVYMVAPLSWRDRARWRAAMAEGGASTYPTDEMILDAVKRAVTDIGPANLDELLSTVDAWRDYVTLITDAVKSVQQGETPDYPEAPAGLPDRYAAIETSVRAHPTVSHLYVQRVRWHDLAAPLLAAYGLRGWEGVPGNDGADLPFRRVQDTVPDDLLDRIPPRDLQAIGDEVWRLAQVGRADRGNSASPSQSPRDGRTSTSTDAVTHGQSSASPTSKTRVKSSRSKSGK
ncbi:hypothetical protein [Granulibacter bethesdensis]|nr:hypothetical protein [Granulibacter bethesdensis]